MTFSKPTPERIFIQCRKERRIGTIARLAMLAAIVAMLIVLGIIAAKAQVGLTFGPTLSNYRLNGPELDHKWKESLNAGLYANIKLAKWLSVQPELIYISKGPRINHDNPPATDRFRLNHNYVEMPVVFHAGPGSHLRFEAGGYVAYMVSMAITKFNYGVVKRFGRSAPGVEGINDFNRIDYGVTGGLSYRWDVLTFAATYEHGFPYAGKKGGSQGWTAAGRAFPMRAFRFAVRANLNGKP